MPVEPGSIQGAIKTLRNQDQPPLPPSGAAIVSLVPVAGRAFPGPDREHVVLLMNLRKRWIGRLLLATLVPPAAVLALAAFAEAGLALWLPPPAAYWTVEERGGEAFYVPAGEPVTPGAVFRVEEFPARPAPGVRRVVCVGGSTTYGHPFEPPGFFSDWLAVRLPVLLPGRRFEVLNLGCNGFSSRHVADLVDDLAEAEVDLLVVYVGHNEFLDQNLPEVRRPGLAAVRHFLERTRLGRLLLGNSDRFSAEGEAGFADRARVLVHDHPFLTLEERERGYAGFERQVQRLLAAATERGWKALVCLPVSDVVDTPVQYSSFSAATPPAARDRFLEQLARTEELLQECRPGWPGSAEISGSTQETAALAQALESLGELEALDAGVARLTYDRGLALAAQGRYEAALASFYEARDRDGHPIRATDRIRRVLLERAAAANATVADPRPGFQAAARHGLAGQDGLFVDYCHPDLPGHRILADTILHALASRGVFAPAEDWDFAGEPAHTTYESSMGLSREAQATSLARRGLAVLAQSYFSSGAQEALVSARQLFALALKTDRDCALALAGRGFLHCMERNRDGALRDLRRAFELDPASLEPFVENSRTHPEIRRIFEEAGIGFGTAGPVRLDSAAADPP
jgi:tetratricopeptide (TPR) repeat protein